jgi:hypothetical protein
LRFVQHYPIFVRPSSSDFTFVREMGDEISICPGEMVCRRNGWFVDISSIFRHQNQNETKAQKKLVTNQNGQSRATSSFVLSLCLTSTSSLVGNRSSNVSQVWSQVWKRCAEDHPYFSSNKIFLL